MSEQARSTSKHKANNTERAKKNQQKKKKEKKNQQKPAKKHRKNQQKNQTENKNAPLHDEHTSTTTHLVVRDKNSLHGV